MPIEAYEIAISLVADAGGVTTPITKLLALLERVVGVEREAQTGMNEFVGAIRGADRVAAGLLTRMQGIARSAQDAAAAMNRVKMPAGGFGGSAGGQAASAPRAPLLMIPDGNTGRSYFPPGGTGYNAPRRGAPLALGWDGPQRGFTTSGSPYTPYGGPVGFAVPPGADGGGADVNFNDGAPISIDPRTPKRRKRNYGHLAAELAIPTFIGGDALKHILAAAVPIKATEANLIAQGFSAAQVAQAENLAFATQRKVLSSSVGGNLEIVSDLMTVLQDPKSAIAMMPEYSRTAVALRAAGTTGGNEGLLAAMRSAELAGVLSHVDPKTGKETINNAAMSAFLKYVVASAVVSHGQVGPSQTYQFLKSSGIAGAMLGKDDLFSGTMAIQLAMGSANAGTGLQAFSQQFSAGKMSQAAVHLLASMGIIQHPEKVLKAGMGQYILMPHAMRTGDVQMSRTHPAEFIMQRLLPAIQAWDAANYGKAYTEASEAVKLQYEAAGMQTITSRIPGGKYAVDVVRQHPLIERDQRALQAALGRNAYGIQVGNNPAIQIAAFASSFNALEIAFGSAALPPAIKALDAITGALNHFGVWAKANPTGAEKALEGLALGVAAFGVGTAAAGAMALMTGPLGFVALAGGIKVLGSSLTNLPAWLVDAAAGAAAGAKLGSMFPVIGPLGGAAIGAGVGAGIGLGVRPPHIQAPDGTVGGSFIPDAYVTPYKAGAGRPVIMQVVLTADGRRITDMVEHQMDTRASRRAPNQYGPTGPNMRAIPASAGASYAV